MKVDLVCQHCGSQIESLNHVLFTCEVSRHVWALDKIITRVMTSSLQENTSLARKLNEEN